MIDPLQLNELKHPTCAKRGSDLQGVLVLDVLVYGERAWQVLTRAGEVWLPISQLFFDPKASTKRGRLLLVPKWLCREKFGPS